MERIEKNTELVVGLLEEMTKSSIAVDEMVHKELVKDEHNRHYFILWVGFKKSGGFEDSIVIHFHAHHPVKIQMA